MFSAKFELPILNDKSLVLLVIQILETYFYKLSFFVWKKVKNLAQCSVVICQMPSKIERDIVIDWCRREKGNQEFSYSISPFSPLLFYKVCYIGMSGFIRVGNICFLNPLFLSKWEDLAFSVCIKVCLFFNFWMLKCTIMANKT